MHASPALCDVHRSSMHFEFLRPAVLLKQRFHHSCDMIYVVSYFPYPKFDALQPHTPCHDDAHENLHGYSWLRRRANDAIYPSMQICSQCIRV
jgi:hypothetical protein